MRASGIAAVVLLGVVAAGFGARAWFDSPPDDSPPGRKSTTQAPPPPALQPVTQPAMVSDHDESAKAPSPPAAPPPVAPVTEPAASPAPVPAEASERSEEARRTQRFLHSRRDDGQHAE